MARGRRRASVRIKADMAWVVGSTSTSTTPSDGQFCTAVQLFDFDDIDAAEPRLTAEKSDWFMKRGIVTVYAAAALDGLTFYDSARLVQGAVGVLDADEANLLSAENPSLFTSQAYEHFARMFQTWTMPAYHWPVMQTATMDGLSPGISGLLTVPSTAAGISETGSFAAFGPWGHAHRELDFKISNAGLRPNQGVYACFSDMNGPSFFDWADADTFAVSLTYQFLLQKRRG